MTKVVGVRLRQVGKIYFFAPGQYNVEVGQHVIVETARGIEYGHVVLGEREVEDSAVVQPLIRLPGSGSRPGCWYRPDNKPSVHLLTPSVPHRA